MNWKLERIEMRLRTYGENEGKYVGEVRFENGVESFVASIPPERTQLYLSLIADEVVRSASELGERIAQSMKESKL